VADQRLRSLTTHWQKPPVPFTGQTPGTAPIPPLEPSSPLLVRLPRFVASACTICPAQQTSAPSVPSPVSCPTRDSAGCQRRPSKSSQFSAARVKKTQARTRAGVEKACCFGRKLRMMERGRENIHIRCLDREQRGGTATSSAASFSPPTATSHRSIF